MNKKVRKIIAMICAITIPGLVPAYAGQANTPATEPGTEDMHTVFSDPITVPVMSGNSEETEPGETNAPDVRENAEPYTVNVSIEGDPEQLYLGQEITMVSEIEGTLPERPVYQWQVKAQGSDVWKDIPDAVEDKYTFELTLDSYYASYRLIVNEAPQEDAQLQ